MKKKVEFVILMLVVVVSFYFMFGNDTNKKILATDEELVGIWILKSPVNLDDGTIKNAALQINADGSCIYSFSYDLYKGSTFEGKSNYTCYLNEKKDKFLMIDDSNNRVQFDWEKYNLVGSSLTIGKYQFSKVE